MGKALAIKGHPTRGKEVIELLEMLGGSNKNNLSGNHSCAYYVNGHQNIIMGIDYIFGYEDMQFFSIERFLEKYPFKVGDKVHIYVQNDDIDGRYDLEVAEITSMRWDPVRCKIAYKMKNINREFYKEEIKCKVDDNLIKTTKVIRNKLAIKGHSTRGKEVIELLEMLGGINVHKHMGINDKTFYYINDTNGIDCDQTLWNNNRYKIFTLEELLEKYPFKVSDIVRIPEYESEVRIDKMYWDGYEIQYEVFTDEVETYSAEELNQWNESNNKSKTKMNNTQESLLKKNSITISSLCYEDEVELNFDCEYELIERDGKHILIKKKPKYPTTYVECCGVIGYGGIIGFTGLADEEEELYAKFIILKRCRDAYWKIAGEQMGLDKPWEPKNELSTRNKIYDIRTYCSSIEKGCTEYPTNRLLSFPTEEMRDAFYNNFKELIERCKELL